jgi:hypothetical protein
MTAPFRISWKQAATVATCLAVAASGAVSVAAVHFGDAGAKRPANKRSRLISVKGSTTGLYPGGSVPLRLKIRNRGRRTLVVRRIRIRPRGVTGCPAGVLSVRRIKRTVKLQKRRGTYQLRRIRLQRKRGRRYLLKLRPRRTRRFTVALAMSPDAPDACQGAKLPLRFRVQAGRR